MSRVSTARVRRGALAEKIILEGRVAGATEVNVAMPRQARVRQVLVSPGQEVRAGSPLVEVEISSPDDAPPLDDRSGDDLEAQQERLRRAIEELGRLRGTPSGLERLAAEGALVLARANLQRLGADLTRLSAGPDPAERRLTEQDVEAAAAVLRRAEADQERVLRGADAAAIRRAESDVAAAEGELAKAQAAYRQIVRGPVPADLRVAEREVEQAEETLRLARGIKPVPLPTPTARPSGNGNREVRREREARARVAQDANNQQLQQELAVRQAEQALEHARDRLAQLQRGPVRAGVESAARDVETATRRLEDARERVAVLRQGPDRAALDAAAAAVAIARSGLARAEKRLADLDAGPSPEDLAAATTAVDGARIAVQAAESRLSDLIATDTAHPQQDLDPSAREEAIKAALAGPSGSALQAAMLATGQETPAAREAASRATGATSTTVAQVGAPVDGQVSAIYIETGDLAEPGQAVVTLATSEERAVRAALQPRQRNRVVSGMPASVRLADGVTIRPGAVAATQDVSGHSVIAINVDWGDARPTLGSTMQAAVTLASRADALAVPSAAIREEQGARYVETLDDGEARRVDVATGLETESEVEIVAGLREGQVVRLAY